MHWLFELFSQPSYLQVVLLLSIVCAIGLALGQIKVKGVQLGITFVFFAGIALGEVMDRTGTATDWGMVSLAQNFGLILFVYSLGVQVGPGFFTSLKKGGVKMNMYGLLTIVLTTLTAIAIFAFTKITFTDSMGLLCGAATNTPMLGAAQQSLLDIDPSASQAASSMASACAVGYPFGVIGVLVCLIIFRRITRNEKDTSKADPAGNTYVAEFHVSNPGIFGKPLSEIHSFTSKGIIVSRLWRDGKVIIPNSSTILQKDDHLLAVLNKNDVQQFLIVFGEQDSKDWNRPNIDWNSIDDGKLISKHVLVTRKELNGVKIGSLHLRNSFDINITRINRAGIKLVAYPGFRLQLGDRLTVVGEEKSIRKVAEILGNEEKELQAPNLVAIFIGLFLGVILGSVPIMIPGMSSAIKLGVAGGPIIVGILMGAFGSKIGLSTYTTRSANLMLRQMGIVIYLGCLGLSSGAGFIKTVFCTQGLMWVAASLIIAIVPVLISGAIARSMGHLDYAQTAGMLCAAMANPIALTYANTNSNEQEASEAYATTYPLSMFIRVISAQLLILAFI